MILSSCIICIALLVTFTGASESGIVGGRVAKPHSRPYMASLQIQKQHVCGGVLIHGDYVLTAAHCKNKQGREMIVVLGAHNTSKKEISQQKIKVKKYHLHPKYTEGYDFDVMLLELKNKPILNKYVKLMGLPEEDEKLPANSDCAVAGWGQTGPENSASDLLREGREKLQFSFECKHIWQEYFNSQHMVCTKFDKKNGAVCQGDSGGPLLCNAKLQGITAFTGDKDCDNPKYPHVFTKVHVFLPWIKKVIGKKTVT